VDLIAEQLGREENPTPERKAPLRDPASGRFAPSAPPDDADPTPSPEEMTEFAPEGDPEAAEQPDDATPEPRRWTVKIDGTLHEVTEDELVRGYQRQADYSRKTAEVAAQRREAEAYAQQVQQERAFYAQQLDQVANLLQATLPPEPDWQRLAQEDPIGYVQQRADWDSKVGRLQAVVQEKQRVEQQQQAERAAALKQHLQAEHQRLLSVIPDWQDPARAQAEQQAVARTLRDAGYTDQEISTVYDSRAVYIARKAALYDALMAQRPTVQQRVQQAPRMVKPGSGSPAPDRRKTLLNQLKRSGSDEDFAALISLG
jgi:hypothetical protein